MDKLPSEIIEKILDYLDEEDLTKASKVCRRWHEIICNSSAIMDNIYLYLGCGEILDLPYKKCTIEKPEILKSLDNLAIFQFLTHLEVIDSDCGNRKEEGYEHLPLIRMPHLKSLNFSAQYYEVLPIIRDHKLQEFKFSYESDLRSYEMEKFKEYLKDFFCTCVDLKHLSVENGFPNLNLSTVKFKLQSLEIRETKNLPSNFLDFLKLHKDSMNEMCLEVYKMDMRVVNFIYYEMNLENFLHRTWKRLGLLQENINKSLKHLSIDNRLKDTSDVIFLEQVIRSCQSLEFLNFKFNPRRPTQILRMLSHVMPKLKVLTLDVGGIKDIRKISKWIRAHGYFAGMEVETYNAKGLLENGVTLLDCSMRFLILSCDDLKNIPDSKNIKMINSYVQISINFKSFDIIVKNLSIQKQDRRSKALTQVRMFVNFMVFPERYRPHSRSRLCELSSWIPYSWEDYEEWDEDDDD